MLIFDIFEPWLLYYRSKTSLFPSFALYTSSEDTGTCTQAFPSLLCRICDRYQFLLTCLLGQHKYRIGEQWILVTKIIPRFGFLQVTRGMGSVGPSCWER